MLFWKNNKKETIQGIKVSLEIVFHYNSDATKGQQLIFNNESIPIQTIYFKDYLGVTEIEFVWQSSSEELKEFLKTLSPCGKIAKFYIN